MQIFVAIGILVMSYLLGSVPTGLIIVRLATGKDIRKVESGRTGGTNVMRAAGWLAGLTTAGVDGLKGAVAVWMAQWLSGGNVWIMALAPAAAILGHNYSIFLRERDESGKLRLRGGAGGATAIGGAFALWPPSLFIVATTGALIFWFVGYASLGTMSVPATAFVLFLIRYQQGQGPWEYMLYGIVAEILLIWALRPNIKRLMNGTERLVGYRARKKKAT
ncbi:MAG: glycerol-3-phosphate acyltransferase [Chloroflexota bacterium]